MCSPPQSKPGSFLCLEKNLLGLLEKRQSDVSHVGLQRAGTALLEFCQLSRHAVDRFDLRLRLECLNLHGPVGLHNLLIRTGLGQTDLGREPTLSSVEP